MILAAGLGTRFKPWTDTHPKALAVINGKSLLQRNIEYLQRAGIFEVVVNVHHFPDQIRAALQDSNGWGSAIIISDESDAVLETGGGLKKAADHLHAGSFVLMNVDILTSLDLRAMIQAHETLAPLATLATTFRATSRNFLFDESGRLCGWRNNSTGEERLPRRAGTCNPAAFSGIHVIDPRIFSLIRQEGKFSMVDLYLSLAGAETIRQFDHTGTAFIDVGKPEAVSVAEGLFL